MKLQYFSPSGYFLSHMIPTRRLHWTNPPTNSLVVAFHLAKSTAVVVILKESSFGSSSRVGLEESRRI